MKKTLILAAAFACAAFTTSAASSILIDLGSDKTTALWNNLGSSNVGPAPADGSVSGVSLTPLNGGYQATSSIYGSNYSIQFASTNTYTNLHGIVAQFSMTGMSEAVGLPATLSYKLDGVDVIAPVTRTFAQMFEGTEPVYVEAIDMWANYNQYLYGWDLSDVYGVITDVVVTVNFGMHNSVPVAAISFGSEYNDPIAVPEPSTYALILGGLGLAGVVIARRRRA